MLLFIIAFVNTHTKRTLEVCCVIHPKLHVRRGFGAGLALLSSLQPGCSAFPQAGLAAMPRASPLPRCLLDGSQSPARAHKSPGQVIRCAIFLPQPLLCFFILTSSSPAHRMSFWPLSLRSIVCKRAVRSGGMELCERSCEHEHVWFKITPVSRKRALPARPTATPDNEIC